MSELTLPYESLHERGVGPAIILLNGFFGNLESWRSIVGEFSSTHRVLIPRLPFYSNPVSGERLLELVDHLDRFLTENTSATPVTLVGNAVGGYIAMRYTIQYPHRVDKLVLTGCSGLSLPDSDVLRTETPGKVHDKTTSYGGWNARDNVSDMLSQIHVPTLLIWGLQDVITPPSVAQEFHKHLPKSKVVFLEECGHVPMTEQPALFNYHVRNFLGM